MSDKAVWQDSDVLPPRDGKTNLVTLAAATASAAQDTGITGASPLDDQFITLICSAEFHIVFSVAGSSTITTPVVATATCGGPYPAGVPVNFRISVLERYFRAISTAGGALKWWLSSGPGK